MSNLSDCFADVSGWCASRRLQLNWNKNELLLFGTTLQPQENTAGQAGPSVIKSAAVVRDLGVLLDAQLTMRDDISRTTQACFFHLRQLRSVRYSLGRHVTIQLPAGRCTRLLSSRLLQCCAGRFTGVYTSTVTASSPCRRSTGERPTTTWPRYVGTQGAPLAADCSTNRVRTVHVCPHRQSSASVYVKNLLTAVADVPSRSALREAMKGNFVVPRTRLKLGERAFSVAAPQAWNRLPTDLKA